MNCCYIVVCPLTLVNIQNELKLYLLIKARHIERVPPPYIYSTHTHTHTHTCVQTDVQTVFLIYEDVVHRIYTDNCLSSDNFKRYS